MHLGWCARAGASLALLLLGACAWSAPPPVAYFAELPTFAGLDLAPDGKHIAMLRAFNGRYHLVALNVEAHSTELLLSGNRQQFRWCRFANEERILCAVERGARPGRARASLMAVNVDGGARLTLLPAALGEEMTAPAAFEDRVVSWLPDDRDHVLLAVQSGASSMRIVRLDIYTNAQEPVLDGLPLVDSWYADGAGEVRLGAGFVGTGLRLFSRAPGSEEFTALGTLSDGAAHASPARVLGVSPDGTKFHAALRGQSGRIGVYELSLVDGAILRLLFEDPRFDFDGELAYGAHGSLIAAFHTRDLPAVHLFDPVWTTRLARVRQLLKHTAVLPVSWDRGGTRLILEGVDSGAPSRHYLYDAESSDLLHLGASHRHLSAQGDVRATQYVARDGVSIPAYLTLPRAPGARRLPAVVLPHDGPAARDDARFDFLVQFLASRGYAVLQPNFRGSTGYGRQYLEAGSGQWGLAMQDDVVDGIDWLGQENIADPGRVCILGRGYGGYVALMAAIRTPHKVRCAVSLGAVSDLRAMMTNLRAFGFDRLNRTLILRAMSEWPLLDANSPVHNASRVGVPLLVVHGDADAVVPVGQSRRLARALEGSDREYRYVEQAGGDHALGSERQRLEFLQEVEAFLALYL